MKKFQIEKAQRKKVLLVLLLVVILGIFLSVSLIENPLKILHMLDNDNIKIGGFILAILIFAAIPIIQKVLAKHYTLSFDKHTLEIECNAETQSNTPYSEIALLRYTCDAYNMKSLTIYSTHGELFSIGGYESAKVKVEEIIEEFLEHIDMYRENEKSASQYTPYSVDYVQLSQNGDIQCTLESVHGKAKRKKRNTILIILGVSLSLIGISFYPMFLNPKEFYDIVDDKVYYGNSYLPDISADEVESISNHIIKDAQHIYYKGERIDFVDYESFDVIRDPFYKDKNGLYQETLYLYKKNIFEPLVGDYDAQTFQEVPHSFFYKDAHNIYSIDVFGNPPIKKVTLEGIDIATFEAYDLNWLVDKDRVYFDHIYKLVVTDLDRESFQIVDGIVAKDKNAVYYNSLNLSSEGNNETNANEYRILEGADPESFEKIANNEYQDKNQLWNIE